MTGQVEQPIRGLIRELEDDLKDALATLAEFPDQSVFGIAEIGANLKQSIRYINKLEDRYLCMKCGEEYGDEPVVQYYKAMVHHSCFVKFFGQEKFDRIFEAQEAFKRDYPEQAGIRNP